MPQEKRSPSAAVKQLVMGLVSSLLRRGFNSSKCKTEAKLATARIKLLRNRREAQVRQMRRDIAALIESGRDDTARIRVEHVIREQNIMAANEIIELFCELVVVRLPIIAKQRVCPADLKEGIASLIYAAPRCSDIPELQRICDIFEKKYGNEFVSAATDLRPESGVNRMLIEKLSVRKPSGEVKLKILKEIAKEYQVDWDEAESERELLKPPEELLEGPRYFVEASKMPVKPTPTQGMRSNNSNLSEGSIAHFKDTASAAQAAAESAEKAISAAKAAAYLAKESSHRSSQSSDTPDYGMNDSSTSCRLRRQSSNSNGPPAVNEPSDCGFDPRTRVIHSQSFNGPDYINDKDMQTSSLHDKRFLNRNSCSARKLHSEIKFDDSDGLDSDSDDNNGTEAPISGGSNPPPNRPPPLRPPQAHHFGEKGTAEGRSPNTVAHVHPKLPDYETLAARFDALKLRKF